METIQTELQERDWLYSLSTIKGLGRKKIWDIYRRLGSFSALADQMEEDVWQQLRISVTVRQELIRKAASDQIKQDKRNRLKNDISFICFLDPEFPQMLAEIPDPPLMLFYRGDLSCLQKPMLGIVGSRKPTPYGKAACAHLTAQLSEAGFVIVSGAAYGIDAEAHRSALRCKNGTVGVLGCGLDHIYPLAHRSLYQDIAKAGLLLSEYPPDTSPHPGLFPERNRIISGLSLGVLLIEAAERSGSLITADCALEQGREIFAVPGPIFSPLSFGPHNLIKQGAKLVAGSDDILEEFRYYLPNKQQRKTEQQALALSSEERQLYDLISFDPIHWNELHVALDAYMRKNIDFYLVHLETKGYIASLPGGFYARRSGEQNLR